MRAVVHAAADTELADAVVYLEEQRRGSGARFLKAYAEARDFVVEHPFSGRSGELGTRHTPIGDFRHDIVYIVREDLLIVVAVAHHRRRPGYWLDRLTVG
jgi:plasmid stabilization system protein ParE